MIKINRSQPPKKTQVSDSDRNITLALKFLRSVGIKSGQHIINVGTGANYSFPQAAQELGAHYIGYDLRSSSKTVSELLFVLGENYKGSAKQVLGEFSSGTKSASKRIPDNSQDCVLILTGALSDPYPESVANEVLDEAFRVLKPNSTLIVGSYKGCWHSDCWYSRAAEKIVANKTIQRVLSSPQWKDKVSLERIEEIEYIASPGGSEGLRFKVGFKM